MSLVELKTFYDAFEAQIVCGRLRSEGVEALVFDTGLSSAHGGALPVRVMVLEEDRARALSLLDQPLQGSDGLDWGGQPS